MALENTSNNASSTLGSSISNSATTLTVSSATGFPAANFRILVDSELMLVTNVSGATFTVSRGIEGTGATGHTAGVNVTHILTAGGLAQYVLDHGGGGGPTTNLTSSDFTALNSDATATLSNGSGYILATLAGFTGSQQLRLWSRPIPANSVTVALQPTFARTGTGYFHISFGFYDSVGGKLSLAEVYSDDTTPGLAILLGVNHFSSFSALTTVAKAISTWLQSSILWFKAAVVSGNLVFSISSDGVNWCQIYSESATSYLANSPDHVVWGGTLWSDSSSDPPVLIRLSEWTEA